MFEHSCGVQTYMHASSLIGHDLREVWLAGGKTPPPPLGAAIIAPALLLCKSCCLACQILEHWQAHKLPSPSY